MSLAIVMPAYNEAQCIAKVVSDWLEIARELDGRLMVVNDGSKDDTGIILDRLAREHENLRVIHKPNGGHGDALLWGYRAALKEAPDFIFQVDSDDQFSPSDFWSLWAQRDHAGLVLGIRQDRNDPPVRLFISFLAKRLNRALFGVKLFDANIPFRLYPSGLLSKLLEYIPNQVFAPNIFLSVAAKSSGVTVVEIPVEHRPRKTGRVSIFGWNLWKSCWRSARELWTFRLSLSARLPELTREAQVSLAVRIPLATGSEGYRVKDAV